MTNTNQNNMRDGHYNPVLGRFMQRDPIGYADGINMFAYVGNNPTNKTDPFGLRADWETLQPEEWNAHSSEVWNMSEPRPDAPGWFVLGDLITIG